MRIERVGGGGEGIAKDALGNRYFIAGALPKERVLVREVRSLGKKNYSAKLDSILEASSERVVPPCEYFDQCGGCDFLHWRYENQIQHKEKALRYFLKRGGIVPNFWEPLQKAERTLGYRTHIQLHQIGKRFGFLKRGSQDWVPIDRCQLADPKINRWLESQSLDETPTKKRVEIGIDVSGSVRAFDSAERIFSQVHLEQNKILRQWVGNFLKGHPYSRVLELFCGDGNLTKSFAAAALETVAVDANAQAIDLAQKKNLSSVKFITSRVDRSLSSKLPLGFLNEYDTLVLDPPRVGVGSSFPGLVRKSLKRVLYISCDPLSFIRDTKHLLSAGFSCQRLVPIDMFPQTRHIEFVSLFLR